MTRVITLVLFIVHSIENRSNLCKVISTVMECVHSQTSHEQTNNGRVRIETSVNQMYMYS